MILADPAWSKAKNSTNHAPKADVDTMGARVKVKIWMLEKQIKADEIAQGYGCHQSFVSKFLKGKKASRPLADYFIQSGRPRDFFKDGRWAA